jgi:cytochrome b6-f complex iron-sulfur subunit
MVRINRSQFLELAWKTIMAIGGVFGVGGVLRFLSYMPNTIRPIQFDIGSSDAFPMNTETPITEANAILIHDTYGFHALSLICPHLGCEVRKTSQGFRCPCHGSQFDKSGNVTHGPAKINLRPLQVTLNDDQHLILHTQ